MTHRSVEKIIDALYSVTDTETIVRYLAMSNADYISQPDEDGSNEVAFSRTQLQKTALINAELVIFFTALNAAWAARQKEVSHE